MGTQKSGYFTKDNTRVPSVTTVIGRFKDCGGLVHWAWDLGKQGKDYREVRDKAADAGTMAHKAVDDWIHKRPVSFDGEHDVIERAHKAYEAFLEWVDQTQLVVTNTEEPLVSEKHRFGGTFDAILIRGKRSMADFKTSNSLYPEYLLQVAAYGKLWDENHPTQPIEGGFHLLRFDKIYGDFHHHFWAELDKAWEAFLHCRALYDLDRELKARIK